MTMTMTLPSVTRLLARRGARRYGLEAVETPHTIAASLPLDLAKVPGKPAADLSHFERHLTQATL